VAQKQALGKGLASLLPAAATSSGASESNVVSTKSAPGARAGAGSSALGRSVVPSSGASGTGTSAATGSSKGASSGGDAASGVAAASAPTAAAPAGPSAAGATPKAGSAGSTAPAAAAKASPGSSATGAAAIAAGQPSFVLDPRLAALTSGGGTLLGANKDRTPGISVAAIDSIQANHFQPRRDFDDSALEELAQSIRSSGIIQPLIVRRNPQGSGFELIAGERRLRAAKMAGLQQVPVVIRKSTDREMLELALIENIQRQDLNCVDEALAYFQLLEEFSLTQEEVAERVGKERATVANYLRLLRLPEVILEDLKKQSLSFGHGKALLGLEDPQLRVQARNEILEKRLSVRDTEALVDRLKEAHPAPEKKGKKPEEESPLLRRLSALAQELTREWSAKVEVKGNDRKGKIVIHYGSRDDLDRILAGLQAPSSAGGRS
jgi:ParB family chromosome partitioning protein